MTLIAQSNAVKTKVTVEPEQNMMPHHKNILRLYHLHSIEHNCNYVDEIPFPSLEVLLVEGSAFELGKIELCNGRSV